MQFASGLRAGSDQGGARNLDALAGPEVVRTAGSDVAVRDVAEILVDALDGKGPVK